MAGMVEYKTADQIAREAGFATSPAMPAREPVPPPAPAVPIQVSGFDMAMTLLRNSLGMAPKPPAPTYSNAVPATGMAPPPVAPGEGNLSRGRATPVTAPPLPPWYERLGLVPSKNPPQPPHGGGGVLG